MTIFGKTFTSADLRRVVWTAIQAGGTAYVVLAPGFWKAPNLANAKALIVGLVIAGGSAAVSAVKNWFLADSSGVK